MPRPQTFQPMRWACQPSQSSTPASSPCGISVSPLRGSFSTKTLRSGDALIPALPASALALGCAGARLGTPGNCCPPGLHCRTAPAPAAPQRPRRSTALRAPGHGDAAPGAVHTQVKQAVAAGRNAQAPDVPANALGLPAEPEQHAGKQPLRDQRIAAARRFFNKNSTRRRALIPATAGLSTGRPQA